VTDPEDARLSIRTSRPCLSYGAGHTVHPIQANRGMRDRSSRVYGRVLEIDNCIVVEVAGEAQTFYNHNLDRARGLLAVVGPDVEVHRAWSLLWFDNYLISITPAERGPLELCPADGPSRGGFFGRPDEGGELVGSGESLHTCTESTMRRRPTSR
jgi:hypothetical protein